jgi:hypothetical protein
MPKTLVEVLTHYGLALANPGMANSFNDISPDIFQLVYDRRAIYSPIINLRQQNRPGGLLDLCRYLRGNDVGALAPGRIQDLDFVNQELGEQFLAIPANAGDLTSLKNAWLLVNQALRPHIVTFYSRRNPNTRLRDFVVLTTVVARPAPLANVTTLQILNVIGTVARSVMAALPNYAGPFDGVAAGSVGNLSDILTLHPPGAGFAGFQAWGEGNHPSERSNVKWHFLKHALFIDDGAGALTPNTANLLITHALQARSSVEQTHQAMAMLAVGDDDDDPATTAECADWWRTLNVLLPQAQCAACIHQQGDLNRMQHWFTGGNLSHAYVEEFLDSGILDRSPQLIAYLMNTYQNAYEQYAINRSRRLDEVLVSANGVKVFIAGRDGDNFIIGRIGSNGALGISSCYRPADVREKMLGHRINMMWNLV